MGRPIKWNFQPDKRHEAMAKDACGGYEKLKADIAEKEKMLAEIKQEQAAAISDLERGIKEEMYTECKREYDKQSTQLRIMELALSRVSDSDARAAVRQFYFERIPLKSMKDSNGCSFGKRGLFQEKQQLIRKTASYVYIGFLLYFILGK